MFGKFINKVLTILAGPPIYLEPPQSRDRLGRFKKD
jgi:hypothetical protein